VRSEITCSAATRAIVLFKLLARFGIETSYVQGSTGGMARGGEATHAIDVLRNAGPNPLMEVTDLEAFASIGRELAP